MITPFQFALRKSQPHSREIGACGGPAAAQTVQPTRLLDSQTPRRTLIVARCRNITSRMGRFIQRTRKAARHLRLRLCHDRRQWAPQLPCSSTTIIIMHCSRTRRRPISSLRAAATAPRDSTSAGTQPETSLRRPPTRHLPRPFSRVASPPNRCSIFSQRTASAACLNMGEFYAISRAVNGNSSLNFTTPCLHTHIHTTCDHFCVLFYCPHRFSSSFFTAFSTPLRTVSRLCFFVLVGNRYHHRRLFLCERFKVPGFQAAM